MNNTQTPSPSDDKLVYYWTEINESNAELFGQKCARLAHAKAASIPVPPFFAITAEGVKRILENDGIFDALKDEMQRTCLLLEKETGRSFTDPDNALITAVRSGDPFSMAGAMFSYLNVGINERSLPALIEEYGDEPAVLHMYLDSLVDHAFMVENHSKDAFAEVLEGLRQNPTEVSVFHELIAKAKAKISSFPDDSLAHCYDAIRSVALSWLNFATSVFREEMELEQNIYPSIFVQQMVFGNLSNSAFLACCTHNPINGRNLLHGEFALGTEGRKMMRAVGPERLPMKKLKFHFPDISAELDTWSKQMEQLYRRPQDTEAIIERNKLHFVQIVDAHLSPTARRIIKREFRSANILKPKENIPPIPGIQRTRVIKTSKVRPDIKLETIAQGQPTYPGAVEGRLALSVDDAIRMGVRRWKKTILLLTEPDERVLPILLKRQIDGFATTYGSTHDAAAVMLSHVPAIMSTNAKTEKNNYLLCPDDSKIPAGARVIMDGKKGKIYRAPQFSNILVDDKPILITPHDLSGYEIEKETRQQYGDMSYEQLLQEHSRFVGKIESMSGTKMSSYMPTDKKHALEFARLELITHFIHIMIFEQADELDISISEVQLDVAVTDGSLDRVPGLEHKNIAIERKKDNVILIVGSEVAYEFDSIESAAYSDKEISDLMALLKSEDIPASYYVQQAKLSRHTQSITTKCIEFPSHYMERTITQLQVFETNS
jgi:hypothetical protein